MPRAGLPSLRAARVVEDEKLAVCEALEKAGRRNPGGNVAERCEVVEIIPPIMLRLEQCIMAVVLVACCSCDRLATLTGDQTFSEVRSSFEVGRRGIP